MEPDAMVEIGTDHRRGVRHQGLPPAPVVTVAMRRPREDRPSYYGKNQTLDGKRAFVHRLEILHDGVETSRA